MRAGGADSAGTWHDMGLKWCPIKPRRAWLELFSSRSGLGLLVAASEWTFGSAQTDREAEPDVTSESVDGVRNEWREGI